MKIIHWHIPEKLKKEINAHYRTSLAPTLVKKDTLSIIRSITFDNVAPNIEVHDVKIFMQYVNKKFLSGNLSGVGVEVGAGCGVFSSTMASFKKVGKIYSVEVCEDIVTELMPIVTSSILDNKNEKVIGCVGDFDNLEIPDNSVDFVFDFFSLHHSGDLQKTLIEMNRVLKPGGFIFCFDKARDDSLTDQELGNMLDREYSRESKVIMGVNPDICLTRRMNGEKEYRLNDWGEYFVSSGFVEFKHFNIARCSSSTFFIRKAKEVFSLLPPKIQVYFTNIILGNKMSSSLLSSKNRVYTTLIDNFPKEISLMIAYK
jgi:ubiquinone/menaquinone biosynthesis C-methylase UbiE